MTVTLPESLTYGKVVGRFLRAVGDTTGDPDNLPNATPATGKITFVAALPITKELSATPPTTVIRDQITCDLDSEGYLLDPAGTRGVWLVTGTYRVSYSLTGIGILSHTIEVLVTHTALAPVDLTVALPLAGTPITPTQYSELSARINAIDSGASVVIASDAPSVPAEGTSASYFVSPSVVWPSGLVWSTDPDNDVAPTIVGRAVVSMFTINGTTMAILGATFPAPVADTTVPSTPTGLVATAANTTTVNLTWNASTDNIAVAGYEYRVGGGSAANAGAGTTETVTGLTPSTLYGFEVRAYDATGNRSAWSTSVYVTTPAVADTTAPTPGTLAGSAITPSGFTLTVTGATDETALHATPYRFSTDNGASYSAYQAGATFNATGLAASTGYTCKHQVRDAAGNVATGTGVVVTTGSASGPVLTDTFTRADSTTLGTTTTGSKVWSELSGNYEIKSNKVNAVYAASVVHLAAVDSGVSDCVIEANLTPNGASADCGLTFRMQDAGNFLDFVMMKVSGATYIRLRKWTGGSPNVVAGAAAVPEGTIVLGTTYAVKVVLSGTSVKCYIDGVLKVDEVVTEYATQTKHGFVCYTDAVGAGDQGASTWDDYSVVVP